MPEANRPRRPRQGARTTPPKRRPSPKATASPPRPAPAAAPPPPAEATAAAPRPEPPRPAPVPVPPRPSIYDRLWEAGILNVLALVRRDLAALFLWPVAYAIGAAVIVPVSILGYLTPALTGQPVTMAGVFSWVVVATACLTPLVTMRLLAEERRSGTLEQILASPVRFWELVAAKWLAGLVFFLASVAFTLVDAALLAVFEPTFDAGAVVAGYVGIVLVGAAWVAVGLLAASLAGGRLVAVVAGVAALLVLVELLGASAGVSPPPLSDLLDYASAANRVLSFERGQVVLRDAVYFLGLTAAALFLTERALAARRWR